MADAIIDADAGAVLRLVERLSQDGVDLDQFTRSLAEHLRGVLLTRHGVGEAASVGDPERMQAQSARADERRVLAAIDCLADAATRIRVGSDARISTETALVRACQGLGLPLLAVRLASVEQKLHGGYGLPTGGAAPPAATARPVAAAASAAPAATPPRPAVPAPAPAPAAAAPTAVAPPAAPAAPAHVEPMDDAQLAQVDTWWPKVRGIVGQSAAMRPALQALSPRSVDAAALVLVANGTLPPGTKLRDLLVAAVREVTGRSLTVELAPATQAAPAAATPAPAASAPSAAPRPAPAAAPAAAAPPESDEGVANLMTMFDATPVVATPTAGDDEGQ